MESITTSIHCNNFNNNMKDSGQYTRLRNLSLLAVMAILTMDAKYILRSMESIWSRSNVEDRMLNLITPTHFTTNHDHININNSNTTPLLLLHVGPGKTGTTSIQAMLAKNSSEELLRSDKYRYIGNDAGVLKKPLSYHCDPNHTGGVRGGGGCRRTLSEDLLNLLTTARTQNTNLVGSNEFLDILTDEKRGAWVDATGNDRWDARIVVSYRRLHELLPSHYNQHYKKNRIPSEPKAYGHHNWPGVDGNYKLPPFAEYLEREVDLTQHDTVRTYEAWGKDFSVSVFNVHQEGDMATNFVCQVIPGADELCRKLTDEAGRSEQPTGGKNISSSSSSNGSIMLLDYDILAVHAYEQGLVHEFDNRYELTRAIQQHHKKGKLDLPRACPDQRALEELYLASKRFEAWAVTLGASKPLTDFEASWETTLLDQKLCSVDAAVAAEQKVWKEFFRLRYAQKSMQHFYG